MAFIQIIEFRSSHADEVQSLADEWENATEEKRTVRRRVLCHERSAPDRFFNLVFFDSYEEAMENSALPETDSLSKNLLDFTDGPLTFYDLEVVDDRSYGQG